MYNSGARCSELMKLKCGQVSFDSPTLIHLHGKGRKDRTVPSWPQTTRLRNWFQILQEGVIATAEPTAPVWRGNVGLTFRLPRVI